MNMAIGGIGRITLSGTVPDSILSSAYPYIQAAVDSLNNILWLTPSPYVEVYDENEIRTFLLSLLPYVKSGSMEYSLKISEKHTVSWSFSYSNGTLTRIHQEGSCSAHEVIK